jgi:membrane-associated protease RseP (regulator of RpoE activity)
MEERKKSSWPWIVLAVVLGLLLLCVVSVVAGATGYHLGKRSVALQPMPRIPERQIVPAIPVPPVAPTPPWREQGIGALVISVAPEGPAQRAGLRAGDIIYQVDGLSLDADNDLATRIGQYDPGDVVVLGVSREGKTRDLRVRLGRNPNRAGETPWLGVEYRLAPFSPLRQGD